MKTIEVVAAVITNKENLIYCVKRNNKGEAANKWEFPGGKIELGETHEEALIREIREELDTVIEIKDFITTVKHQYKTFNLIMHVYYAKVKSGVLTLSEHTDYKWLQTTELRLLDWAPADIPVVDCIQGDL